VFWIAIAFLALLQVTAALLNLLPIPGLDGYGAIEPYLDPNFQQGAEQFKPWGMIAVFAFLQVNTIGTAFFNVVYWLFELSGISAIYPSAGFELIKFWHAS
jgi:Zn-dependent protease